MSLRSRLTALERRGVPSGARRCRECGNTPDSNEPRPIVFDAEAERAARCPACDAWILAEGRTASRLVIIASMDAEAVRLPPEIDELERLREEAEKCAQVASRSER